jgi:hypothetical protein
LRTLCGLLFEKLKILKVPPNLILIKNWEKWAKITYFIRFLIYFVFFKVPSKSGKRVEAKFPHLRYEL